MRPPLWDPSDVPVFKQRIVGREPKARVSGKPDLLVRTLR